MADPPGWSKIGGCSLHIRPLNHSQSCCRTLVPRCLDPCRIGAENSAASPVEFFSSRGLHSVCWPATRPKLGATFFSFLDLATSSLHLKGAVLSTTCTGIGTQDCLTLPRMEMGSQIGSSLARASTDDSFAAVEQKTLHDATCKLSNMVVSHLQSLPSCMVVASQAWWPMSQLYTAFGALVRHQPFSSSVVDESCFSLQPGLCKAQPRRWPSSLKNTNPPSTAS